MSSSVDFTVNIEYKCYQFGISSDPVIIDTSDKEMYLWSTLTIDITFATVETEPDCGPLTH